MISFFTEVINDIQNSLINIYDFFYKKLLKIFIKEIWNEFIKFILALVIFIRHELLSRVFLKDLLNALKIALIDMKKQYISFSFALNLYNLVSPIVLTRKFTRELFDLKRKSLYTAIVSGLFCSLIYIIDTFIVMYLFYDVKINVFVAFWELKWFFLCDLLIWICLSSANPIITEKIDKWIKKPSAKIKESMQKGKKKRN